MFINSDMSKLLLIGLTLSTITCFGQGVLYQKTDSLINAGMPEQAINLLGASDITDKPELIYQEGLAYLHMGRNTLAEEKLTEALSIFETHDEKKWQAKCLGELGNVFWARSQNYQALQYHFNALNIREKLNDKSELAASYNDIGLVYSMIDPELAGKYYKMANEIYLDLFGSDHEKVANSTINMALMHSKMGHYQQALKSIGKAFEIKKNIYSMDHPDIGFIHSARGEIYVNAGRFNEALESFNLAGIIYRTNYGEKHPELANIYNRMASIHLNRGHFNQALQSCQEAIKANHPSFKSDDFFNTPEDGNYYNPDFYLVSLILKGQAFETRYYTKTLNRKDLLESFRLYEIGDRLIDELRHLRTNQEDKLFLNTQANNLYENAIAVSLALEEISFRKKPFREKAFYFSEKSKAVILLDAINDANAKQYANIPPEMIDHENELKSKISYISQQLVDKPDPEKEKELRNQVFELTREYNQLIGRLENDFPEYYSLKYDVEIPEVAEIQAVLPENKAIQSYFIADNRDRLYVFQISDRKFRTINVPLKTDLTRTLIGFRNSIFYDLKDEFIKIGSELYDQLVPKDFFNGITDVVIIPSGRLGVTPFEALVKNYDEGYGYDRIQYLVREINITYQFSATLFLKNLGNTQLNHRRALLAAPVEFNYGKRYGLSPLPGTVGEIRDIDTILVTEKYETRPYLYADASESMIKSENLQECSFIHIASHGVVNEQHPELSCIYLAGDDAEEDGNLYTGEIYNLRMNADLVSLSACQTGMGKIHEGEGIIGLSRALLYAGARNMLVSLWRVNDESTARMMTSFYRNATSNNQEFNLALGNVKRTMINSSKYNAPYHWASFVLIGK